MAKKIVWSKRALVERIDILEFWKFKNKSIRFSLKLDELFLEKIELVSIHPNIGKMTEFENIRYKIARDYLIFYEIFETEIHILSIKYGKQHPLKFRNLK